MNKIHKIATITGMLLAALIPATAHNANKTRAVTQLLSHETIASLLGWVDDGGPNHICHGHYHEPKTIHDVQAGDPKGSETHITADTSTLQTRTGWSALSGHVNVYQPGRHVSADHAFFYREAENDKVTAIVLDGHVRFQEHGKLIIGDRARVGLMDKSGELNNALYRIYGKSPTGFVNAWGHARKAKRESDGTLKIIHGTYSTCSPKHPTWILKTNYLKLDHRHETGEAHNTFLYFHHMPIFYFPYFSFPLTKERKSGFLVPTFAESRFSGYEVGIPFYLNLAPNYDDTFRIHVMTKRGALLKNVFRMLTPISYTLLNLNFISHDREFNKFKQRVSILPGDNTYYQTAKQRLFNSNSDRGYFSLNNVTNFDDNWHAETHLNYVTDDYYLQDFGRNPLYASTDQLLNQALLNYKSSHIEFLALVQGYQTLHPFNEPQITNPYRRLPELDLTLDYPNLWRGIAFHMNTEWVHFDRGLFAEGPVPIGDRLHVAPRLSLPIESGSGYIKPSIEFNTTYYGLFHQPAGFRPNITRTIPIANLDAGVYLERDLSVHHHLYTQTLEPRVYYLYVPFRNQNDIPNFDTVLPTFSVEQLFRSNRFVGIDRIGDTHQVTLGITSRLLDQQTGDELASASLAEAFYFKDRRVCLTSTCGDDPSVTNRLSPLVGRVNVHLNQNWFATADMAWDPRLDITNNASIYLHYQPDSDRNINVGYDFVRRGDLLSTANPGSSKNDLSRLSITGSWPLNNQISIIGAWNYNLSHGHPQTYLYGFEYNSCCWAIRFVTNRYLTANGQNGNPQFDRQYYIQVQLKGLGNFGRNKLNNLLRTSIHGYHDPVFNR